MTLSPEKPDILIVTVTKVEQEAVIRNFIGGKISPRRDPYIDLGRFGNARVWMAISGMGSEGTSGSMSTIRRAITETQPQVVIMVGIAFGVNENNQKIGDILVSEMIVPYESQRLGKDNTFLLSSRPPATSRLLHIFRAAAAEWQQEGETPVYFGSILSGNKLFDNLGSRNQLINMVPNAIGGEMEGAGLCFVAHEEKKDWILIKSICDWADGNKDQDKDARQARAADNAARFTLYVLKNKDIIQPAASFSSDPIIKAEISTEVDEAYIKNSTKEILEGLKRTNYKLAADVGLEASREIGDQFEHDDPSLELLLGDFRVSFALALIYSGGSPKLLEQSSVWLNRVIHRLEHRKSFYLKQAIRMQERFHLILGRAYNHLGYSYWMDRGHYEAALGKFNKALEHFIKGKWKQETATTYDNLARVYAQLGFRSHAESLCAHGLKLREENIINKNDEENQYRLALSLNSSAIIHLTYGQSLRAYLESEKALGIFEQCARVKGERGIGLALITKGQASRMLGSCWQFTNDTASSEAYLQNAMRDLKRAESIFKKVDEEIRLIQIYNELGCVYREFLRLYAKAGREEEARDAEKDAREYFASVLDNPENAEKYPIAFIDTWHDLAQTVYITLNERSDPETEQGGLKDELNNQLDMAERMIPEFYTFPSASTAFTLPVEECFEDYWQNLGKIYALRGDLELRGVSSIILRDKEFQPVMRKKIADAFRFYILAAGYYSRYLERPISPDNIFYPEEAQRLENHFLFAQSLYDHLSLLNEQDVRFLKKTVYEQVIEENKLKPLWPERFFKQSFALLLRDSDSII